MTNALRTTISQEERTRRQLEGSIARKKEMLSKKTQRVETLRMELHVVEHEYNVRIGALLIKDNQLDLEIIQQKNLKNLLDQGFSYNDAVKKDADKFYSEFLRMQEEQEAIDAEKELIDKAKEAPEDVLQEIKKLWKKLIVKFHPDLTSDLQEKTKREEIVKKINQAYTAQNLEALKLIESDIQIDQITDTSIPALEKILVDLENMIIYMDSQYMTLRNSEWYGWRQKLKKAKRANKDIFLDLEKSLIDDILKKITILKNLRAYNQTEATA